MRWQADVTGPDGVTWTVGRQVLPWRPRVRWRRSTSAVENLDPTVLIGGADDLAGLVVAPLAALLLLVVTLLLLGPVGGLLAVTLEWALALLLVPLAVAARVLLGRPWTVYADNGALRVAAGVTGWRSSAEMLDSTLNDIRVYGHPRGLAALSGLVPPPGPASP